MMCVSHLPPPNPTVGEKVQGAFYKSISTGNHLNKDTASTRGCWPRP